MLWSKTYGGTNNDVATCVHQTTDGGFIISGNSSGVGILIKTNSSGTILWSKEYGNSTTSFSSVKQTNDGGYIIAGSTNNVNSEDAYLLKVDNMGNVLWAKTYTDYYGSHSPTNLFSVQQTTDGGYIACGSYLLKVNSAGDITWSKDPLSSGLENGAYAIQQTNDGGYIIGGGGRYNATSAAAGGICKIDSIGNTLWSKGYCSIPVTSIQQTNDGNYIAVFSQINVNNQLAYLLIIDGTGNFIWSKQYQSPQILYYNSTLSFNCVQQASDGGFIIVGYTGALQLNTLDNICLVKTDVLGESNCNDIQLLMSPNVLVLISNSITLTSTSASSTANSFSTYVNSPTPTDSTLCTTVGIQQFSNNTDAISIYPNPATDNITIESPQQAVIEISNIQGQLIKTYTSSENKTNVNVSLLPSGVYVVKVKTEKGIAIKKFVKE